MASIKEMHIECRQSMQNVGTNTRRRLEDDELDWLLNKNQQRFIQSHIKARKDSSGGFEVDELDTDAIRTLLKTDTLNPNLVAGIYECQLPDDYSYLISDDSNTSLLCGATPAVATRSENILSIKFPLSAKGSAKYYATVVLTIGSTTIALADILGLYQTPVYTGLNSKVEKWLIIDSFLWYIRNVLNIAVYWETYLDVYSPSSFIFPGYTSGNIVIDGQAAVTGNNVTRSFTTETSTVPSVWYANRLINISRVSSILQTAFYKSHHRSPISVLQGRKILIYKDVSFIVTGVSIDYVKKPRRMSLLLNQDCELPDEFHQSICDLTEEYFKAMTADPNWQVKLQDTITRNPTAS